MSLLGTTRTSRNVRFSAASGDEADIGIAAVIGDPKVERVIVLKSARRLHRADDWGAGAFHRARAFADPGAAAESDTRELLAAVDDGG
jgi:hypothetical protein